MTPAFQPQLDFDAAHRAAEDGEALVVDLDGFEGPLHVLLALARTQKVDLLKLSITTLAEQYLAFVHAARTRRFSLAADYLVMAAWLTFLKSRLLFPRPERPAADEPPAEALAFRLAKLDAMRRAVDALTARPRLGRDVFPRGEPEARTVQRSSRMEGDLFALVAAYAAQRTRAVARRYSPGQRIEAYPLEAAREHLRETLPALVRWTPLTGVAPQPAGGEGPSRTSYLASTLSAGLEMVKEGALDVRQTEAFAALYLRARRRPDAPGPALLAAE